ncbi:MAG: AMP-binding protein [Bacteroidota bacterium]
MPELNAIQKDYLLAEGFTESCRKFPMHQALYIGNQFYTYNDLLQKAEIIFEQFQKKNTPAYIGIYTDESVWTYAAIIAVSLTGACYVPLNARLPDQKLQTIIKACKLQLIISGKPTPFSHQAQELIIDTGSKTREKISVIVTQPFAYLLFTSGTTGEPKGVPVSKKNCESFFRHYQGNFDFNASDKFLQPYELSFDVSVFCIFSAWHCGACLYVVPEEGFKYLNCMQMIKTHDITITSMVPTVLQYLEKYLDEFSFDSLRYSFFSGDKLYHHLAKKWSKLAAKAQVFNCYGPTETTVVCTSYLWEETRSEKESVNNIVPLGKPFEDMAFILVNEQNEYINAGTGELCFTGKQVIDHYLGQQNEDCFFEYKRKRYYKTGDLAAVNENGNLIFYGRNDSQVKINGFRVELTEIENVIFKITGKNVVVIAGTENNLEVLFAFIENAKMDETKLRTELSGFLPVYMIPAHYRFVNAFPKNINGKIDRRQLKQYLNE